MRGAVLCWPPLRLVVWALLLPPPASPASPVSPHTPLTPPTPASPPPGLLAPPEGGVTTTTTPPHGGAANASPFLPPVPPPPSPSSSPSPDGSSAHRHRHHHAAAPLWLRPHLAALPPARRRSATRRLEDTIGAVFRGVSHGGAASYRGGAARRPGARQVLGAPRIERTTALTDDPQDDYLSDGSALDDPARNDSTTPATTTPADEARHDGNDGKETVPGTPPEAGTTRLMGHPPATLAPRDHPGTAPPGTSPPGTAPPGTAPPGTALPGTALPGTLAPEVTGRGGALAVTSPWQVPAEEAANGTEAPPSVSPAPHTAAPPLRRPAARLSWLEVLRCTHRGLAWVLVNFLLGFLLLALSLLGPYRLLTLRCCTPLLPRTHYVAVQLLVFVAASLKAVYLFHLAFGSRGRLPLVLLLLLTNRGSPCLASAFVVLLLMMLVAADVQLYKWRLVTAHNAFLLLVAVLALAFVADVIVGCAHSRSVLLLARLMVIAVAAAAVVVLVRRHAAVVAVCQMMQREVQGELKLLVAPAREDSLQRQAGVKQLLRSRLAPWCRALRVGAAALALLSLLHLLHTVFLVSAHVPAWAWWLVHVCSCLVEALLAVSICVAAALTQRYDEDVSFPFSFVVPPLLLRGKSAATAPAAAAAAAVTPGDGEAMYQRVSFSSGTESTQYTACCPEGGVALAGTPQAPRRRGAPVKRSATFSHTPHVPHAATHVYGHASPLHGARVSSASNLPLHHLARRGVYGPGVALHGQGYGHAGDASVLVHEDGFVRVRTSLDPRDAPPPRPHGSLILLQQAHFRGSSPQLPGAGPEPPPRQDGLYQSLSRRRRAPRGPEVLHNNIDVSESECQSSPSSRTSYGCHSSLASPHSPARDEMHYYSLSRRSGRAAHPEAAPHDAHSLSWRRRSHRDARDSYMNNLDRPEGDARSLAHRQVSREDNNDPVHHHYDHHAPRRASREARAPSLNLYEEQGALARPCTLGDSPGLMQKVSNRSFSPSSPTTPPAGHAPFLEDSPRSRRQARYPRPFVRVGSNRSLQGEDLYADYAPRGNPVRRNHSSAGYYPSRYLAPSTPSLVEAQRYNSLRATRRKRQPVYALTPDGKLLNRYPEEWLTEIRARATRTPEDPQPCMNGPEGGDRDSTSPRECPSRQSTSSRRSDQDQDWATELIKSSSMLTDFYSLPDQQKARRKDAQIPEEQEE